MKIFNKIGMMLLAGTSLMATVGCSDLDDIITSNNFNGTFRPTDVDANTKANAMAKLTWVDNIQPENYVIDLWKYVNTDDPATIDSILVREGLTVDGASDSLWVKNLQPSAQYKYNIRATSASVGESARVWMESYFKAKAQQELTIDAVNPNSIALSWPANLTVVSQKNGSALEEESVTPLSYSMEVLDVDSKATLKETLPVTQSSYVAEGLSSGRVYQITMKALLPDGTTSTVGKVKTYTAGANMLDCSVDYMGPNVSIDGDSYVVTGASSMDSHSLMNDRNVFYLSQTNVEPTGFVANDTIYCTVDYNATSGTASNLALRFYTGKVVYNTKTTTTITGYKQGINRDGTTFNIPIEETTVDTIDCSRVFTPFYTTDAIEANRAYKIPMTTSTDTIFVAAVGNPSDDAKILVKNLAVGRPFDTDAYSLKSGIDDKGSEWTCAADTKAGASTTFVTEDGNIEFSVLDPNVKSSITTRKDEDPQGKWTFGAPSTSLKTFDYAWCSGGKTTSGALTISFTAPADGTLYIYAFSNGDDARTIYLMNAGDLFSDTSVSPVASMAIKNSETKTKDGTAYLVPFNAYVEKGKSYEIQFGASIDICGMKFVEE